MISPSVRVFDLVQVSRPVAYPSLTSINICFRKWVAYLGKSDYLAQVRDQR